MVVATESKGHEECQGFDRFIVARFEEAIGQHS